ncbi:WD40-repeat-containing domain protein [Pilobolus umbonatus]|nr:WD40-repeat-containing domain protein [Pilobolus umbonatus]
MQIITKNTGNTKEDEVTINNIRKDELVRLMLQTLIDLDYHEAAQSLQYESGVSLESDMILSFRKSILEGDWPTAETLLSTLPFLTNEDEVHLKVKFLIRQQKFLELLEDNETMNALHVLRTEITPLNQNTERLHQLSSLVLCSSIEDIMSQAQWDGRKGTSREQLLNELQNYIEPSAMIPKARLMTLIDQSFQWQKKKCLYHNPRNHEEYSLFSDHICDKRYFPTTTIKIFKGHTDEVWHVAYSHSGKYLASVSKDKTCIIWDMETLNQIQLMQSDESGSYCAWSPDDSKLLVCGIDHALRLWNPFNGFLLHMFKNHEDQVTSCVWLPDGEHFISGACDHVMYLWSVDSKTPINRWSTSRTTDMKMTEDGRRLVTISLDKCINIYDVNLLRFIEVGKIEEQSTITSLTLTKDGRYALVNIQDIEEIHLWDLEEQKLVHTYVGQRQVSYIIRSTLGSSDESFVLSGSEDNHVYIWSREYETLLEELEGHTNSVNCVSWSPREPMQFVSASDDATIRVWGFKSNGSH